MTRRRGFGNVRKLPSGRWQARYWLPGGGHLAAPETFRTKAEANRWLATVQADKARGLWVDPQAGRIRLEEYAATLARQQGRYLTEDAGDLRPPGPAAHPSGRQP